MIEFILPIDPQPKLRPRFDSRRKITYTPAATKRFEQQIKFLSSRYRPRELLEGPLTVEATFYLKPPMRTKNKLPIVRPDLDNFFKAVTDALNGLFWKDDSQICDLTARKIYDWTTKQGSIRIRILKMEEANG